MLSVDLGQLEREGFVELEAVLPADADLWAGGELRWAGDVDVRLRATVAGTGEVVVRGQVSGVLEHECRRCLKPGTRKYTSHLTLVFVEEGSEVDGQDGAYAYEQRGAELDMSIAVREEVILALNPYAVCKPECKGLCPRCGTNLNEETCDCIEEGVDPRWEALRNMKSE